LSHPKHLNTPRLVADSTGTTVWRWDQAEPFGNNPADEDPDANSVAFDLPLRLPGQRYDQETGLHYNYTRDYDPGTGRYIESDLIGLEGGINTYLYADASPLWYTDPGGTNPGAAGAAAAGAVAIRICMRIPACKNKLADLLKKAADLCKRVTCELKFEKKGHPFPTAGGGGMELCMHWQINCYIKGVKGSGFSIHSRLPICWKPGEPFPPSRPPSRLP
jgi:RHS repeat-associated protein